MKTVPLHYTYSQFFGFCDACQCNKVHKTHFPITAIKLKLPVELLHTDLWGPASECSMNGFKYYVSFVDDFTRYC